MFLKKYIKGRNYIFVNLGEGIIIYNSFIESQFFEKCRTPTKEKKCKSKRYFISETMQRFRQTLT